MRLQYDVKTPYGLMVAQLAAHMVQAQQLAQRIKAAMDQMSAAPATDSVAIATELGMPTPTGSTGANGEGNLLYTVVVNAVVNLTTANSQVAQIDQGLSF